MQIILSEPLLFLFLYDVEPRGTFQHISNIKDGTLKFLLSRTFKRD